MPLSLATSECYSYWNLRKAPSSNLIVMLKAPAKHVVSLPVPILGVEKTNQKYILQKISKVPLMKEILEPLISLCNNWRFCMEKCLKLSKKAQEEYTFWQKHSSEKIYKTPSKIFVLTFSLSLIRALSWLLSWYLMLT